MTAPVSEKKTTLRRSLSVWQAVGISVALMAPSMAANINPQGTAGLVGRATPLAFFLAAVAVLLIAYVFVRLCQYYRHAGSVYVFAGATLGARAGAVAGLGLMGTYVFYALVTASAAGIFGSSFLDIIGVWNHQPAWAGFLVGAVALGLSLFFAVVPARRATSILLSVEGITVALILVIAVVVLVRMLGGSAPNDAHFTMSVFSVPSGTPVSDLGLGIVFGLLSFAGFEAAATLGEEAEQPQRDIPRAILGTAIFGGVYFTVVTAIEMMAFKPDAAGVKAFIASPALMGDLGTSYVGSWVGDLITLGAAVSAFGCCLACVVGASRLLFAIVRDAVPGHPLGRTGSNATPAIAAIVVTVVVALIALVCAVLFHAEVFDTFLWSGTIGTLILLVAYVLATVGCIKLIWVDKKMDVPGWQIVIPLLALVMLGYTIWRNVLPYPASGQPAFWFPIVAFGWVILVAVVMFAAPGLAKRLTAGLRALDDAG
ncbi:APC family permease [Nocardioides mangrovicus]|uniref:APC family permease n=1 Tax=Nocardioides mangrovicus TaxID=2478913 RepID=A0A3L8NWN8_9ACTN|nr:APC family permease [Nocardioides mangrovicus]RLV47560.1 APC family permease [Nocardioides mangrovicus]